jgi:hypothetical protein
VCTPDIISVIGAASMIGTYTERHTVSFGRKSFEHPGFRQDQRTYFNLIAKWVRGSGLVVLRTWP